MRIHVLGDDTISQQARAYAEYRLFAALTRFGEADRVRDASVVLHHAKRNGYRDVVICRITVTWDGSNAIRMRTTGQHSYAAINRAIERLTNTSTSQRIDCQIAASG